jgi:hypothetical protein
MRLLWSIGVAALGLALSIEPMLAARAFPEVAALQQFPIVVLGGLIAIVACRQQG